MADASVFVMNLDDSVIDENLTNYPKPCFVNVGTGMDCTIKQIAETIKEVVGYKGDLRFDTSKPDGTPRKLLDVASLNNIGWNSRIKLLQGLADTYGWYVSLNSQ